MGKVLTREDDPTLDFEDEGLPTGGCANGLGTLGEKLVLDAKKGVGCDDRNDRGAEEDGKADVDGVELDKVCAGLDRRADVDEVEENEDGGRVFEDLESGPRPLCIGILT